MNWLLRFVLLLGFVMTPLASQTLRGTVVDGASGAPMASTLVVLLDLGTQRGRTLSSDGGSFVFALPAPGRYRVRAERIGYAGVGSPLLEVGEGETRDYRLQVRSAPIALEGIRATGTRRCTPGPDGGAGTAALWEEARKALNAAALTQEQKRLRVSLLRYERELELPELRVAREQAKRTVGSSSDPYVSLPAEDLSEGGYIRRQGDTTYYYGPDEGVLLSDLFLQEHCFFVRDGDGNRVGLAFRPVPGRKLPDVSGVLWLDRSTSELRELEYTYANLPAEWPEEQLGGRVEFERLPSGAWYIPHWRIRMPLFGEGRRRFGRRPAVVAVREEAGEVEEVRTFTGEVIRSFVPGTLTGTAWDSTRNAPLAGARVRLVGTAYEAETDSAGRYRIYDVPGGSIQGNVHPSPAGLFGVRSGARCRRGHSGGNEHPGAGCPFHSRDTRSQVPGDQGAGSGNGCGNGSQSGFARAADRRRGHDLMGCGRGGAVETPEPPHGRKRPLSRLLSSCPSFAAGGGQLLGWSSRIQELRASADASTKQDLLVPRSRNSPLRSGQR